MSGLHADTAGMNTNGKDTVANAEYFSNELSSLRNNVEGLMSKGKVVYVTNGMEFDVAISHQS